MGRTPAFRHMGGKARLRKWLVDHFPDGDGGTYLEPFAGKGNVFFEAVQRLNYSRWILADGDTGFLNALIDADLDALPATVERQDFEYWRSSRCAMTLAVYRPLSRIIPHLCGLTKREREKRVLTAFDYVAFVDDSGNSPSDLWFILAAWVATVPEWENFTEDWNATLKASPSIEYFKHNEALGQKNCFAGFTAKEVREKSDQLIEVILRHDVYSVVSGISHQLHTKLVQGKTLRLNGRLPKDLRHGFYLSFFDVIKNVLEMHNHLGYEGKIDFVFDGAKKGKRTASGPINRCVQVYNRIKDELREADHPYYPMMGTITSGDDKELKPLQAADFLAGQIRMTKILNDYPIPLRIMKKAKPFYYHELDAAYLKEQVVTPLNKAFLERHGLSSTLLPNLDDVELTPPDPVRHRSSIRRERERRERKRE